MNKIDSGCVREWEKCWLCRGEGQVTLERNKAWLDAKERGKTMQEDRLKRGLTLGQEARRLGVKPSDISKLENGET
jgi:predicted transcriptional regulator